MIVTGYMLIEWNTPFKNSWQWSATPQRIFTNSDLAHFTAQQNGLRAVPVQAKLTHGTTHARYFKFIP